MRSKNFGFSDLALFCFLQYIVLFNGLESEMPMAALPLPRRTRGGGSGSLFFITVAARRGSGSFQKKKI
jgi:hypothetical protein